MYRKVSYLALAVFISGCGSDDDVSTVCNLPANVAATKPADIYQQNDDGTVTDLQTGLIWSRTLTEGNVTWQKALELAKDSDVFGHSDWRLPNVTELASLVDTACDDFKINTSAFPKTGTGSYVSSTGSSVDNFVTVVQVSFLTGEITSVNAATGLGLVRLVRGGQQ